MALNKRWKTLDSELCSRIISILENENLEDSPLRKQEGKGTHYVVTPFMLRNGYIDGAGWWVYQDN